MLSFISTSTVKKWPQAEAFSPAGWSSNTLLEWGRLVKERMWDEPGAVSCCPKRKQGGGVRKNHQWLQNPDSGD